MRKFILKAMIHMVLIFFICFSLFCFIMLGPYSYFREIYVTTAMTTLSHQYLARSIYSEETIEEIMNRNKVICNLPNSNEAAVHTFSEMPQTVSTFTYAPDDTMEIILKQKFELEKLKRQELTKVELITLKRKTYTGFLLKVNDPSRVILGSTDKLGSIGLKLKDMVVKYDALAGINAGGFVDVNGEGFGGTPTECIIENSKIVFGDKKSQYDIIGFNKRNVLVLGSYTLDQALEAGIRDAVAFSPYLIVDGEPVIKEGNGGWGLQPRTAIGQTKDGKVLLLTIDGRQMYSLGATLKDVQDILFEHGAYNAANLDGGSSTVMYYEGKLMNKPCSPYGERFLPSAFIVTK